MLTILYEEVLHILLFFFYTIIIIIINIETVKNKQFYKNRTQGSVVFPNNDIFFNNNIFLVSVLTPSIRKTINVKSAFYFLDKNIHFLRVKISYIYFLLLYRLILIVGILELAG